MTASATPAPPPPSVRRYEVRAESTSTFGRVLLSARDHHVIIDGPEQNGCPGEEITPVELILGGVATCGVELLHVIARDMNVPLTRVRTRVDGMVDRSKQPRTDVTVFTSVRIGFALQGVDAAQGAALVEGFKRR
jgi:uncharacterized OsmC-like protein